MADVTHRTTLQHLKSVNTPDYPVIDWIINGDRSAVTGYPVKYHKTSGDNILLMTSGEQAIVDAQIINDEKNRLSKNFDRQLRAVIRTLNDGSFVPGSAYTKVERNAIFKAKL